MEALADLLSPDYDYTRSRRSSLLARFWGNSALYALTSLLTRLGNFILLPVYWRFLSPDDFGAVAVAEMVIFGLLGILTFCLEGAVTRFYHEWSEDERPRRLGAVWIASLVSTTILALVAYGLASVFWDATIRQVPFAPLVQLAILAALVRSLSTLPFTILRIREELLHFTAMSMVAFVINAGAGLYLVAVEGWGAKGVIVGTIAGYGTTALAWLLFMRRRVSFRFRRGDLAPSLAYSAPLVPASLVAAVAALCDRFFLERFATIGQLGLYAVAGRFAQVVKEGNQSLKNSWIPFATRLALVRPDAPAVIGRLAKYYIAALLGAALAVALLGREFVLLFASDRYAPAIAFMPVLVFAAAFDAVDVVAGVGLTIRKATRTVLMLTLAEATMSLSAIGVLSLHYGALGAMWGVLLGRGTATLMKLIIAGRAYPVPFEFGRWLGMATVAGAAFAAGQTLNAMPFWAAAAAKLGLLAAYAAVSAVLFLDLRRGFELLRETRATPAPSEANPRA